jgi:predicted MFS family arabinose efflux permease
MATDDQQPAEQPPKPIGINPLAPLTIPIYRNFWLAGLFSNTGTWMHETGAIWLMTDLEPRPEMVSAVRVAMTIPVFCLALAAGVWADHFNRRSWLLGTQSLLLVIALVMWLLTSFGLMTPWILLALTAGMGVALILNLPAWQAMTPELVPPAMIPSAVQAGSVSFNLARSVGPALAGLAIAQFGVGITFLFNAISFLGTIFVLLRWKHSEEAEPKRKKKVQFVDELKKGIFIVRNSQNIRSSLIRVLLFALTASALWSLLSLVATEKLGFRERGFGACLAALGVGAVLAAGILPWLRQRLTSETLALASQIGFAILLAIVGTTSVPVVIGPALLVTGACWMFMMTTLNATAQVYLPRKFRARGMSAFVMFFSLGMGAGSLAWGWLAKFIGLGGSLQAAAAAMAVIAVLSHRLKLGPLVITEPTAEVTVD